MLHLDVTSPVQVKALIHVTDVAKIVVQVRYFSSLCRRVRKNEDGCLSLGIYDGNLYLFSLVSCSVIICLVIIRETLFVPFFKKLFSIILSDREWVHVLCWGIILFEIFSDFNVKWYFVLISIVSVFCLFSYHFLVSYFFVSFFTSPTLWERSSLWVWIFLDLICSIFSSFLVT